MPITTTVPTIPHSPNVFGDQTNAVTTGLPNGGYVVAWSDNFFGGQRDVKFQIYNGLGEPVGGVQTANANVAGEQIVRDIVATADGKFTILWSTGSTLTARAFDAASGAAVTGEQNLATSSTNPVSGAQAIVTGANTIKVLMSSLDGLAAFTVLEQAIFNTGAGTFGAKTTVASNILAGINLIDLDQGNGVDHYALLAASSSAVLVANNGSQTGLPSNVGSVAKVQENVHFLFSESANGSLTFHTLTGFSPNVSSFVVSNPFTIGGAGAGNTGQDIFAKETVNLGNGRILILWVAESGTGANNASDGVYGAVFDTITSSFETGTTRIAALTNVLSEVTLDARLLSDGRVSLTIGTGTPTFATFSGKDVLSIIVDPRNTGIQLSGTAQADKFIGTSFNDTFTDIGANDIVDGSGGGDTVSLALNVARTIDLANPDRFASPSNLTSIEVVNLGNLDDVLYGFTTNDNVTGGGGNDLLFLRTGNDKADGGAGNDTISGAGGTDNLLGDIGNDVLSGGADADVLNGGGDNDSITGGEGNDIILGGDGVDKLYGNGGDDEIDGGTGVDFISGGNGNDLLLGGADNDTITAGDGDDIIDAGAGNDLINAGSGFNTVDGGAGSDTLSYSQVSLSPGQSGVLADLEGGSDPFGSTDGVTVDDDVLVNIENLFGGDGNDFLYGSVFANVLRGFGGDDTLFGRGNSDTLIGGAGNDRFVYDSVTTAGGDQIRDFSVGQDKVLIVSAAFGGIHQGNIAASFTANADALPAANGQPQFLFDTAGGGAGRLFFDADGNGAGAAVLIATLTFTNVNGLTTFSSSDFAFL